MYFDDVNHALPILAGHLARAPQVGSRQGEMTRERTMARFTLANPLHRYITVPGRRASLPAQIAETMWVLAGRNDIGWLSNYLPRAADFSDDGKTWRAGYGPRIRRWVTSSEEGRADVTVDQLAHVVELLKTDPDTRRAVISLYDPAVDTAPGKDIACNNWLSFIARRGELDLHVATRSNDLWWGWSGINQFEWSVLQEIVAELAGLRVGELHFSITSLHLYEKHWDKAKAVANHGVNQTGGGQRFEGLASNRVENLDTAVSWWFEQEERIRAGKDWIATGVPLFDEWLEALSWWWTGEALYLDNITDVVRAALLASPVTQVAKLSRANYAVNQTTQEAGRKMDAFLQQAQEGTKPSTTVLGERDPFNAYVDALHREKGAAYGDSWKKRGEQISILANVYRKVDRLGQGTTSDETAADTAIDLLVYLIKYRWWLTEQSRNAALAGERLGGWTVAPPFGSADIQDEFTQVSQTLDLLSTRMPTATPSEEQVVASIQLVKTTLDEQYDISAGDDYKARFLDDVITILNPVARHLWAKEQASTVTLDIVPDTTKLVEAFRVAGSKAAVAKDVEAIHRVDQKRSERNATRRWNGYGDGDDE